MKKILTNKYFIALAVFFALLLFSKSSGIFRLISQFKEIKQLKEQKSYYDKEIENTKKLIKSLEYDTAVLEKYAREKYFMKKDNEDVFVIIRDENRNKEK